MYYHGKRCAFGTQQYKEKGRNCVLCDHIHSRGTTNGRGIVLMAKHVTEHICKFDAGFVPWDYLSSPLIMWFGSRATRSSRATCEPPPQLFDIRLA